MRQKGIAAIIILVAVAIVGTVGYFLYQNNNLSFLIPKTAQTNAPSSSTPKPTAQTLPEIDETINNNKVINKTFKFEITFPEDWEISPSQNFINPVYGGSYALSGANKEKNYRLSIFYAPKGGSVLPGKSGFGAGEWVNRGSFTFLGKELNKSALVYEGNVDDVHYYMPSSKRSIIDFPESEFYWNIFISYNPPLELEKVRETERIAEQILSTFKFIK